MSEHFVFFVSFVVGFFCFVFLARGWGDFPLLIVFCLIYLLNFLMKLKIEEGDESTEHKMIFWASWKTYNKIKYLIHILQNFNYSLAIFSFISLMILYANLILPIKLCYLNAKKREFFYFLCYSLAVTLLSSLKISSPVII